MNRILESVPVSLRYEGAINEKILNFTSEQGYADESALEKTPWEVFWALSSVRKYQFLFYPFKKGSSCLVLNDCFASLTGVLCEKSEKVDFYATSKNEGIIKKRWKSKDSLTVFSFADINKCTESYDYAFVNLEYNEQFLHHYVTIAFEKIKESGVVFFSANKYQYQQLSNILYDKGLQFRSYDLFDNGMLLVESVKSSSFFADKSLFDWSQYKKHGESYSSPLLYTKWIRDNDIPFYAPEFYSDQDSEQIQEVKKIILDLLKKLISVCHEHGLKVYPIYGTLLGAMRNGGLIEGDDDIDLALMRPDYDKLMTLAGEFTGKYFLQSFENDDCFYGGYAKLRNTESTAINPQNWWTSCCEGIGIDIFPIDKTFDSKLRERSKLKRIRFYQRMLYAYSYGYFRDFKDMPLLKWKVYKYLGKIISKKDIISKFNKILSSGDSRDKLAIYTHYGNGSLKSAVYFDSEDFEKSFAYKYDGILLEIPCGWNNVLKDLYGEGYQNPPGFNEFKMRHGFYDARIPYNVWKNRFGGLKNPSTIKENVILFGDGSLFQPCLKYYNSRVNVSNLVLLPGEEMEEEKIMGIPVISFDEFEKLNLPKTSYRGIICSGDALLADSILAENGYPGFYIFWHDRNWMLFANQTAVWKCIRALKLN